MIAFFSGVNIFGNRNLVIQSDGGDVIIAPTPVPVEALLYDVRIEGQDNNLLVAYDETGNTIWQKKLDATIKKALIEDLDGDGNREVIAGLAEPGDQPGWLFVFDEAGVQLSAYNVWEEPIYIGGAKSAVNIVDLQILDPTNDGPKQIVVIANDVYWYPSKLSLFEFTSGTLKQTGRFWNPGLLYTLNIDDLDGDQIAEMVVTGVNNDLQVIPQLKLSGNVYIVFILNGDQISGQSPPWFGEDAQGPVLWYGFVTPLTTRVTEVDFEDIDDDGIKEVHITLSDVCSFFLDMQGNIVGKGRGTACQKESELYILATDD